MRLWFFNSAVIANLKLDYCKVQEELKTVLNATFRRNNREYYGIIFENGPLLSSIVPSLGSLFTHNFLLGKN